MKWTGKQYIELMTSENCERQMFCELFGPLHILEKEWRGQGVSEQEISMAAFDWDYVPVSKNFCNTGVLSIADKVIIEENEAEILYRDGFGCRHRLIKASATIPLPMEYPVKNMNDWLKIKPYYQYRPDRIDRENLEIAKKQREEGALTAFSIPGGFDTPRKLMGEEEACVSVYEQPELIHDILQTVSDTAYRILDEVGRDISIDNLSVHEDMAGKSGPMFGPGTIQEFIKPYYRRIWDLASERGTKLFSQDSDGNMNAVIDAFLDCGVNIMYPMEPAAGMDIVSLRKKYGKRLMFKGGIDKHVLRGAKADIDRELHYKIQPLMQTGGVVFGLDHRIPNGTPIENYRYYVCKGRELLGLPPLAPDKNGWARMAF